VSAWRAPAAGRDGAPDERTGHPPTSATGHDAGATAVALAGGSFRTGSVDARADAADGEGPMHVVELSPFRIHAHAVTNDRFAAFVDATGHVGRDGDERPQGAHRSSGAAVSPGRRRRRARRAGRGGRAA